MKLVLGTVGVLVSSLLCGSSVAQTTPRIRRGEKVPAKSSATPQKPRQFVLSLSINPAVLAFGARADGMVCRSSYDSVAIGKIDPELTTTATDVALTHSAVRSEDVVFVPPNVVIPVGERCVSFSVLGQSQTNQDFVTATAWQGATPGRSGYTSASHQPETVGLALFALPSELIRFRINDDSGTGTARFVDGAPVGLSVELNHADLTALPVSITTNFTGHNMAQMPGIQGIPIAAAIYELKNASSLAGRKKTGTISAEYRNKTITREVEILPPAQIQEVCLFDISFTEGSYSSMRDYCEHRILPAVVVGGKMANGFVRRSLAAPEPVLVELSSSDPAFAAISPSSMFITQKMGLPFTVTTQPTGGVPRTVIIKVVEGGYSETLLTLTVK